MSLARIEFDAPEAGLAFGAEDVAFSHAPDYARAVSPFQDSRRFQSQATDTIAVRSRSELCLREEHCGSDKIDGEIRDIAQPARSRRVGWRQPKKFTCVMVEADAKRQACSKLIRALRPAHTERVNMKLIDLFAHGRKQHPDETGSSISDAHDRTDRSSMADLVRLLQEHDDAQNAVTPSRHKQPGRRQA